MLWGKLVKPVMDHETKQAWLRGLENEGQNQHEKTKMS